MIENTGNFKDTLNDEVIRKDSKIIMSGHLKDIIRDSVGEKEVDQGNNQICIGCHKLICSLVAGLDKNLYDEPLYFAVGNSDIATDSGQTKLPGFLFKHKIGEDDEIEGIKIEGGNTLSLTVYLGENPVEGIDVDEDGNNLKDDTLYNENDWKECAIYKGNVMLNRKVHSTLRKTNTIGVMRTFKFTF